VDTPDRRQRGNIMLWLILHRRLRNRAIAPSAASWALS
jgi:hypothetical protein